MNKLFPVLQQARQSTATEATHTISGPDADAPEYTFSGRPGATALISSISGFMLTPSRHTNVTPAIALSPEDTYTAPRSRAMSAAMFEGG
jgi:hypothetical protein